MTQNGNGAKAADAPSDLPIVRAESVQDLWNARRDGAMGMWVASSERGPILPPWGSRDRERALRGYYRNEYSTLLQGAFSGLIKKVVATGYEIKGGRNTTRYWQDVLWDAQFEQGWGNFLSRFLLDYLRQDGGAYAEIIAPGDPLYPPTGPAVGIAHLDSMYTWATGDPEYPAVYWSRLGKLHLMHRTRLLHLVDMPDGDQFNPGYGLCALSRAIAVVQRQLYMSRYIVSNLDDLPSPGMVIAQGITDAQWNVAWGKFRQQQSQDNMPDWGRVATLFGVDPSIEVKLENFTFSRPPEKFDFPVYVQIDIDEMALAIGVDVQDLRPLSSGNVGTAKQSEVLHAKAEGKAYGDILTGLERAMNRVLPTSLEFSFKTHDPMAAQQDATTAQLWTGVATSGAALVGAQQAAQMLADQVEAWREVLTDEDGNLIALGDLDIQPAAMSDEINAAIPPQEGEETTADDKNPDAGGAKDYAETRSRFVADVRDLMRAGNGDELSRRRAGTVMRAQLSRLGRQAYQDGLKAGGVADGMNASDQAALTAWLSQQNAYVTPFLNTLYKRGLSAAQIDQHADMWANKSLRDAYQLGLARADSDGMYEWELGLTEYHCTTCAGMNGQKHRMSEYMARRITPGSFHLECRGYQCRCILSKSSGASVGNWV